MDDQTKLREALRCFACDKKIGARSAADLVDTRDDQLVYVGAECRKKIEAAGEAGYQPPKGGPRLFLIDTGEGMRHKLRDLIEGMSVSVDVSTCEEDSGHRYFGTVTEVMDDPHDKHGVTLLVQNAEPNFEPAALAALAATATHAGAQGGPCMGCDAKQARIDELMLEHCPDEMTPKQMAAWEAHQQPYELSFDEQKALNRALFKSVKVVRPAAQTQPAPRVGMVPMTPEQISNACERIKLTFEDEDFGIISKLARAIESHHGIAAQQEQSEGGDRG